MIIAHTDQYTDARMGIQYEACHNRHTMNKASPHDRTRLIAVLSRLPLRVLYALSDLLYVLLYRIFRFQRGLLIDNLRLAFPTMPETALQKLATRCYRHALDFLVEAIRAWRIDPRSLCRRAVVKNPELMNDLTRQHTTVIAVTSHYANWEWLLLAGELQVEAGITVAYNPLSDTGIDRLLRDMRGRFGSTPVDARRGLRELARRARTGGILALNADQAPRPEDTQYWSLFLGQDTAFFTGPEKLARLCHAPVVFAHMRQLQRGYYAIEFELLCTPPYGEQPGTIMEAYIRAVERQILEAPEYWFWLYKRWKLRRPDCNTAEQLSH
jgi:KDO2-lipid IV(A) lauroyltransferase